MNHFELKVWRLHPGGVRIEPAERTLKGTANKDAMRWCGPYNHVNKYGFWLFPPIDLDFIWYGDKQYELKWIKEMRDDEVPVVKSLVKPDDPDYCKAFVDAFSGRMKVDFGRVEENILQIWTGAIFQTPPNWCLHIRSPVNFKQTYQIQEGILETDWMRYDIWINVIVPKNQLVQFRHDQLYPLAQLLPVQRDSYDDKYRIIDQVINRDNDIYLDWAKYNYDKYLAKPEKDSATYYKKRNAYLGGQ